MQQEVDVRAMGATARRPLTLRVAVALLWGKAAFLGALTAWLIYADMTEMPANRDLATFVTGYTAVYAVILAFVGWAVFALKKWSRGPALLLELFLPAIGFFMLQGGQPLYGALTIALGLLGVAMLISPTTRHALGLSD